MKTKTLLTLALATAMTSLCATRAMAIIDITSYASAPSNSGNAIPGWLDNMITGYNTAQDPDLPTLDHTGSTLTQTALFRLNSGDSAPAAPYSSYQTFGSDVKTFDFTYLGDFNYLLLHFGNGDYRGFYVGDESKGAVLEFTSTHGLSWYEAWDPRTVAVPEPTTVVAGALLLLPFGLSTLLSLRKKNVA